MGKNISGETQKEVLKLLKQRYRGSSKSRKSKILDEFAAVAGCHRKHAIRLLGDRVPKRTEKQIVRIYDEAVQEALIIVWEAADRICGKRLEAILPILIESMEHHVHIDLEPALRDKLTSVSAATIDRLLKPIRENSKRRHTKRKTGASRQVPTKTFADWEETPPGFFEIDFVAHCGGTITGSYIHSFVATDVSSGWTEAIPLLAREQSLVVAGLTAISRQLPISINGINSDNDSAFINDSLINYCNEKGIDFTRSRPYRKNDQAWIEQKNGSVIRRFVGYDRFSGPVACQVLAKLFALVRLYVNYYQPSFKLIAKSRDGGKVSKRYDKPATPCDRLLASPTVGTEIRKRLKMIRSKLDPIDLLNQIRNTQAALAALASEDGVCSDQKELKDFLSELPRLWRQGEVRPTHIKKARKARYWRTREDPFADVWNELLSWLQNKPESTAKQLFERLQAEYPEQYPDNQLRTLQRRVKDWRNMVAKQLVYGAVEDLPEIIQLESICGLASKNEPFCEVATGNEDRRF